MKAMKQVKQALRIRRVYVFDTKIVNKDECIVQSKRSINVGDCDQVEVHMHAIKDECPGVHIKDENGQCFRFGKGL